MDTDEIKRLEMLIKDWKRIKDAADFLFMETAEYGFSRDTCYLWATWVLRPSLRTWVHKVSMRLHHNDNVTLT